MDLFRLDVIYGKPCLLLLILLAASGCGKRPEVQADASPPAPAQAAPGVVTLNPDSPALRQMSVESVKTIPLPAEEVDAPARIQLNPNRVSHAVLPVPGRIARVLVKLGDSVTKGQPVAMIDSPVITDAESVFIQAQSAVHQAELTLAKADADLNRVNTLFEHGATAEKEVAAARTTQALAKDSVDQAQSVREQARRKIELLGLKPGQFQQQVTVDAPIAGKILTIDVVEGEYHNDNNVSLLTIADLTRVWATSEVPESQIRYCRIGGAAELELIAFPGETFRARVTRIADTVDKETRTIQVSAELDNPSGRLRPEMYGRLRYSGAPAPTPWVPEAAVVESAGKNYTFLEQAPGRFQATQVELGKRVQNGFAITKGLKAGDRVVTQGAVYLKASL
jgi:cobalt-zinc-cadmium efflux system membrane fusion protein